MIYSTECRIQILILALQFGTQFPEVEVPVDAVSDSLTVESSPKGCKQN